MRWSAPGLTVDDLDLFVAHQANARIIEAAAARARASLARRSPEHRPRREHVVGVDPARAGRRPSATGACSPARPSALAAFGAGFVWGAGIVTLEGARACLARDGGLRRGDRRHARHRRRDRRAPARPTAGPSRRSAAAAATSRRRRRPRAVAAASRAVRERFGPMLVLVNNAGIRADGLAIRCTTRTGDASSTRTSTGAFNCTQPRARRHAEGPLGRIVNVSSVVAERANPGQANYVAAKAGLLGFTRTVAREMARKGITCNAITPGVIETDMTADLDGDLAGAVPAGRVGRPDEVAAAVASSCSDEAAYVNGATLVRRRRARRMKKGVTHQWPTYHQRPGESSQAIRDELDAIKVPGAEDAEPEQTWSDLDVDSLDLVELVKALEDRYGIPIADGAPEGDQDRRRRRRASCRSSRTRGGRAA